MLRFGEPVTQRLFAIAVRFVLGLSGLVASIGLAHAETVATGTRLGQHPDRTRFVVDLSEPVEYRIFALADPYRIVIELPAITWLVPREGAISGRGVVQAYRYGQFSAERSRVVLDLGEPAEIVTHFILPAEAGSGVRLVLDLKPSTRETFLAGAGWPSDLLPAPPVVTDVPVTGQIGEGDDQLVIVIDPGHGGVDPGATGTGGLVEKDVVLAMAIALRDALAADGRFEIIMTRDDDRFLTLQERVNIARAARADLFISLHADSVRRGQVRGASIYTLSDEAMDSEAAALAQSENAADVIAGVEIPANADEVSGILIDLAQRQTKNLSVSFAQMAIGELGQATALLTDPHRFAGFRVLTAPDVPSVLLELGFLSNTDDEQSLQSPEWQARVADALGRAAATWFERKAALDMGAGGSE